jgi:pimeloyl-ACP methyl ester carboxylesterase
VRLLLAVLTASLLVSACASGSSEPGPAAEPTSTEPTSTEPTSTEPAADPDAPVADLHVECRGEAGPTVVLVAGLNTSGRTFRNLQADLAGTARTCFYDRAGIGDSAPLADAAPDPSPGSAAEDLRATLAAEGIDPPYVLLGWSYGGLVAQAYAGMFHDDLAGLVLEDTSVRGQFTDPALVDSSIDWMDGGRQVDREALLRELAHQALGNLTVAVLSQDADGSWVPAFYRAHDGLARSSSDGVHAVAIGSGHAMHEDVPGLVRRTVEAVLAAARADEELPGCRRLFAGERVRCRV